MAVHQYNSWGRTRGPKNIAGPPGTAIEVMAEGDEPDGITGSDGGYATENQRYLHVTVEPGDGGAPGVDIEIWVYLHAAGIWSRLALQASPTAGVADRLTNVGAGLVIDCSGQTVDTTYVIEILGVDRVAFVRDGAAWDVEPDAVYAACSTF